VGAAFMALAAVCMSSAAHVVHAEEHGPTRSGGRAHQPSSPRWWTSVASFPCCWAMVKGPWRKTAFECFWTNAVTLLNNCPKNYALTMGTRKYNAKGSLREVSLIIGRVPAKVCIGL
jgi:hypothetical protein